MLRRSFLSHFGGAAAFLGISQPAAPSASKPFEAAKHPEDDWLDKMPGVHRAIFDTWTASKFAEGVQFAGNYARVNVDAYKLTDKDVALVLCTRHNTAPFAFNDAMWAKYGKHFCDRMEWVDPKTREVPKTNIYTRQLANLSKSGMQFAICALTTRAYTRIIANATGAKADDVFAELSANTIGVSHFVPAGVVAVTRAQERGYSLVVVG
jgi:intracellular sulfur oxidation DsrE/DsrF family protein